MAVAAAILFTCLIPGKARCQPASASVSGSGDFSSLRDSISAHLEARHFPTSIALSRDLLSRLKEADAPTGALASGYETLARCLRRGGLSRQQETLDTARRAVALCRENPDSGLMAASLNTLALVLFQRSDYDQALPMFIEATNLWSEQFGPNDQHVAAGLNNQGLVLNAVGRHDEARRVLEKSIAIYASRAEEPRYRVKQAQTAMTLSKLEIKLGQYEQAWLRGEDAVRIFRETLGLEHPRVGSALGDLAALARSTGDLARAGKLYEEALPILEKGYGPEHTEVGRALNNLGNLYADQGNIAEARRCFERALAITQQTSGPESPQAGVRLLNLASILTEMGDLELAQAYLAQAEDIFRARLGNDHLYMGYAKQEMGTVLVALGQLKAGQERLNSALVIFEHKLGPDHLAVAELLDQSGALLIDMKHYAAADTQLSRGVDLVRKKFVGGHPLLASLLLNKGRLTRLMGNPDISLAVLGEGLDMAEKIMGSDHPLVAALHLELSRNLAQLQRSEEAFSQAMVTESTSRNHFFLAATAFEEDMALAMADRRTRGTDLGTSLAISLGEKPPSPGMVQRLWDEVLRSRGLVGEIMALRRQLEEQNRNSPQSVLSDSLTLAARDLAQLIVAGPGQTSPNDYAASLESARWRWNRLDRRMAATGNTYATMAELLEIGLSDIAVQLPHDGALISFLKFQDPNDREARFAALVLRSPQDNPEIVSLGPADLIKEAVARWRHLLQVEAGRVTGGHLADTETTSAAGQEVARLVWQPLGLDAICGPVYIIPDGVLNFVDFGALPRPTGGFLIENSAKFKVISSARDLLATPHCPTKGPRTLLAMGGIEFGLLGKEQKSISGVRPGRYGNLKFPDLPETRREAEAVTSLWRELKLGPTLCFVGDQASEAAFKNRAKESEIIHLATHGFFLAGASGQHLPGSRGIGLLTRDFETTPRTKPLNPLLLSGLAFAGANLPADGQGAEDGILTAYEVAAMDLSGVNLVVLSACQTGEGDLRAGEGVMGFRRSFATAGVSNLVMSLGGVRDEVARKWMDRFYRYHLSGGLDYQAAAQAASRTLLADRRRDGLSDHPAYWAPFIAVGPGY